MQFALSPRARAEVVYAGFVTRALRELEVGDRVIDHMLKRYGYIVSACFGRNVETTRCAEMLRASHAARL